MAESVQYTLESMIPELEDLEEKGLFVKPEIQSIVKKRTKLEYVLRRPSPKKTDFLKYIEYELNLEALRKKRKTRLLGKQAKSSVSDFAGMRRINFLFERVVRRYHGDVGVWLQYAEFAKSQSSPRLLSRVLVRALQYHPGKPELWIMAAKWEFDGNLNIVAARSLMQRGLRLIPSSEDMWHAYHGLELAYVVKLIHRRRILGIDAAIVEEEREITGEVKGNKKRSAEEEGEEEEGEDDGHILLPTITDEEFKEGEKTEEEKAEEEKQRLMLRSNSDAFLAGALPRIVYRHAIVAIPSSLDFRLEFIKRYEEAGVDTLTEAKEEVWSTISRDFSSSVEAVGKVAERYIQGLGTGSTGYVDGLKETVGAYDRVIQEWGKEGRGTAGIEIRRIKFLTKQLERVKEENLQIYLGQCILQGYDRLMEGKEMTGEMYEGYMRMLVEVVGERERAREVGEEGILAFPKEEGLWEEWVRLLPEEGEERLKALDRGLKACPGSTRLWDLALRQYVREWREGRWEDERMERVLDEAISLASTQVTKGQSTEEGGIVSQVQIGYVDWGREANKQLDQVYRHIVQRSQPTLEFLRHCLALEREEEGSETRVAWLYEQMTRVYPTSQETWLSWIKWLYGMGRFQTALRVHDRACRSVQDVSDFEKEYQALLGGLC